MLKHFDKIRTSSFICFFLYPVRETRLKTKHTKISGHFFFRKKKFSSFVRSQNGTHYALFLGCFDLKLLPDIPYPELWLRFEPQIFPTRFAINFFFIVVRAKSKIRLCVKLFGFISNLILICLS